MTTTELIEEASKLRWYHKIELSPGVFTAPEREFPISWELIENNWPKNLSGQEVLDVGTRDGQYAFRAERDGATVLAIDSDQSPGALLLAKQWDSRVKFSELSVYDVAGQFDAILFFGVLYHLRFPMLALSKLCSALKHGGQIHIETAVMDEHHSKPMLYCPVRDSPYEITSCSFFNVAGLKETLWSFGVDLGVGVLHDQETGPIRRCFATGTKTHEPDADLAAYWGGIHKAHN